MSQIRSRYPFAIYKLPLWSYYRFVEFFSKFFFKEILRAEDKQIVWATLKDFKDTLPKKYLKHNSSFKCSILKITISQHLNWFELLKNVKIKWFFSNTENILVRSTKYPKISRKSTSFNQNIHKIVSKFSRFLFTRNTSKFLEP